MLFRSGLSSPSVLGFSGRKEPQKTRNGLGLQAWEAQVCHPSPFRGLLAEKGKKTQKPTGMTTLGSLGLSSQSVLGFSGRTRLKTPNRTATLGSPRLSSQSVWGFSGRKGPKNPEMDWDDNPGKTRLVIPIRFGVFWPKRAKKTRNGLG